MCSLVILRRPDHPWPLLLGANRDEMKDRAWRLPGRHWQNQPDVVAGQDISGGGTWQGLNDAGLVAAVLNRANSLGPADDKLSRGQLPLLALAHGNAGAAATALALLNPGDYRPFNLFVADRNEAYWLVNPGQGAIGVHEVPQGLSMLTAHDLNDTHASPRMARNLPRFARAQVPEPATGDWLQWQQCLADPGQMAPDPEHFDIRADAMRIQSNIGFETLCSSLIALPADNGQPWYWLFDSGQGYQAVSA